MPEAPITAGFSPGNEAAIEFEEPGSRWPRVLLIEDDAGRSVRRALPGISSTIRSEISVRLHRIARRLPEVEGEKRYDAGTLETNEGRAAVAMELLDCSQRPGGTIVAAGTTYGANLRFLCGLRERSMGFAVELPPSALVQPLREGEEWSPDGEPVSLSELLHCATWSKVAVVHPTTNLPIDYLWADFGAVCRQGIPARLLIIQTGQVQRLQRGTIFAFLSDEEAAAEEIISVIGWTRWIRPFVRKLEREGLGKQPRPEAAEVAVPPTRRSGDMPVRVNITLARQQDETERREAALPLEAPLLRRRLAPAGGELKTAELFAGAGGMGLGFLLAGMEESRYRLVFSGEVHPIYVETLRRNHHALATGQRATERVPQTVDPLDLRTPEALDRAEADCRAVGGIDVLIGGPPCQGFSSANRNSGHSANPHNQLVDVFLRYVETLKPRIFLMENVQGIVWTPKNAESPDQLSTAEDFTRRTREAGYLVFPKLLDAVWYGVPQHRNRFFILGLASDLGYQKEDFGYWGPFPLPTHGPGTDRPYVTVRDAIGDLPPIWNGCSLPEIPYEPEGERLLDTKGFMHFMRAGAAESIIWDHVTSRHAGYVIERFLRIPPGGNWQDIEHLLSNYSDIERTHSNIYRRLVWDEPSITIGHYRKSMLVHPNQERGLSLREACRLQSFPDWFRFAGSTNGGAGGLTHKQQQLANAVCPLVTRAIADFILQL